MRRYLKLFFITAMISPIVACGGSTEEKNIDDKTLVIWHSLSSKDKSLIDGAISTFKVKYPDYQFKTVQKADDSILFSDSLKNKETKDGPDIVFTSEYYLPQYLENDLMYDISSLFNSSTYGLSISEKADLNPILMKQCTDASFSKIQYLPFRAEPMVMAYNKATFDECLTHIEKYDGTWNDMYEYVMPYIIERDSSGKNKIYFNSNDRLFLSWLNDYSFDIKDIFDNINESLPSGLVSAIDLFANFNTNGYLETRQTNKGSARGGDFFLYADFVSQVGYYNQSFVDTLPSAKGVVNCKNIPASSIMTAFIKHSNYDDKTATDKMTGAWLFFKELLKDEIQENIIINTHSIPLKMSTVNNELVQSYIANYSDNNALMSKICVDNINNIVTRTFDIQSNKLFNCINDIISECFLKATTLTPGTSEFHEEVHKIFKKSIA